MKTSRVAGSGLQFFGGGLSPRALLLLSIGFALGAFLSTFSAKVAQLSGSIGIRLPQIGRAHV